MKREKLRVGMIGGGKDAFIGAIHRLAQNMDGQIELCCGALSVHPEVAKESGEMLFLPDDRIYSSYEEMIKRKVNYRQTNVCTLYPLLRPILCTLHRRCWHWSTAFMW